MKAYSAALATALVAKRNTMTIETDPQACIEIETMQLYSYGQHG